MLLLASSSPHSFIHTIQDSNCSLQEMCDQIKCKCQRHSALWYYHHHSAIIPVLSTRILISIWRRAAFYLYETTKTFTFIAHKGCYHWVKIGVIRWYSSILHSHSTFWHSPFSRHHRPRYTPYRKISHCSISYHHHRSDIFIYLLWREVNWSKQYKVRQVIVRIRKMWKTLKMLPAILGHVSLSILSSLIGFTGVSAGKKNN